MEANEKTQVTFESYKDTKGYIVSLDKDAERYNNTFNILTKLGFSNLTRWRAVNASEINVDEELVALGIHRLEAFKNNGEKGCALSHLRALGNFLGTSEEYCLIFEDDVIAHTQFAELKDFQDIPYGSFDLLSFGGIFDYYLNDSTKLSSLDKVKELQGKSSHVDDCVFWQTHAYLASRKFAEKAVAKYAEYVNNPHIKSPALDHYYSESGFFKTKLIAHQNTKNNHELRLNNWYGRNICGVLFQDNQYQSNIQNY